MATTNVTEKKDEGTSTYFFPRVVHLRLADGSLLKFAPGPREVPNNLHPAEMEILKRNGVKPIGQTSKQVIAATEAAIAAPATDLDTAKVNAIQAKALAQSSDKSPELATRDLEFERAHPGSFNRGMQMPSPVKDQATEAETQTEQRAKAAKEKAAADAKSAQEARAADEAAKAKAKAEADAKK